MTVPAAALDALNKRNLTPDGHHRIHQRLTQLAANGVTETHMIDAAHNLNPEHITDNGHIPDTGPAAGAFLDPQPQPIPTNNPPPFPLDIYPDWLAAMSQQLADELQTPNDLPATVALGVLSLLTNRADITVNVDRHNWIDGTNLYLACALPPGGAKSPVFGRMTEPLKPLQQQLDQQHTENVARWKAARIAAETHEKETAKDAKTGTAADTELHIEALIELDTIEQQKPQRPRIHLADTTPEALIDPVAASNGRTAIMSAEGTFFGALARYIDRGRQTNIDIYLAGYSGDAYTVDRRNRDTPVHIPTVRLVICVLTQPAPLHRILTDADNTERGLADRFMIAQPTPTVGHRRFHGHTARVAKDTADTYHRNIAALADILEPEQLTNSTAAVDTFNRWRDRIESERSSRWAALAGMPEKVHQAVARTAAILHIAWGDTGEISHRRMADATYLGDYWLETARQIATITPDDIVDTQAQKIMDWYTAAGHTEFSLRDLRRAGVIRPCDRYDDLAPALERLAEHGHVELPKTGERVAWYHATRGTPSPKVYVRWSK